MNINTHLELFLLEGEIELLPSENTNGVINVHDLPIELFYDKSLVQNEYFHEGDTVYFFIIPTKYIVPDMTGLNNYTAINVSRIRRRVFMNGFTSNRPCTNGTTIPAILYDTKIDGQNYYYNYTINEYNQLGITLAPFDIPAYTIVFEKENKDMIKCPANSNLTMFSRRYDESHPDKWE